LSKYHINDAIITYLSAPGSVGNAALKGSPVQELKNMNIYNLNFQNLHFNAHFPGEPGLAGVY